MLKYKRLKIMLCGIVFAICGNINSSAESSSFTVKNFTVSPLKFSVSDISGDTDLKLNADYSYTGDVCNLYGSMESLPSAYDMRDDYSISPVRDQTGFGTCWAHSAIASAEASIIDAVPDIDLSEFHTAYYPYYGDDHMKNDADTVKKLLDSGGNTYMTTNIWSQWIGPVLESRLPYRYTEFFSDADDVADMQKMSDYHFKNAYLFDYDRKRTNESQVNNLIKQYVYEGKPVDVAFCHTAEEGYNYKNNCVYSTKRPRFANHSVAIVGWDDNFSADNFNIKPECDGAWLVRNSWGSLYGDNGYMWISYDDRSLNEFAVFELSDKDDCTVMYSHDTFVINQAISAFDDEETNEPSYIANVFENDSYTDIEAVSAYIASSGTDYEITVYTGLSDISDPCSGKASSVTSGTADMSGYVTIELDEKVPLSEYDGHFGVVMKLYNKETPFVVPVEVCLTVTDESTGEISDISGYTTHEQMKSFTAENESFFSMDGSVWYDTYNNDYIYTEEEEKYLVDDLRESLMDGIEDDAEEIANAEAVISSYQKKFDSGYVTLIMGNIPLKALGNPKNTVRFSHISGEVPVNEKIELSGADEIYYYIDSPENIMTYSEPIAVEKPVTIYASSDGVNFSQRKYSPACSQLNDLKYKTNSIFSAEKINKSRYNIYIRKNQSEVALYPSSAAYIENNGSEIATDEFSLSVTAENPVTSVELNASQENKLGNTIKINIYKTSLSDPKAGDVNGDGVVNAADASEILRHYASISSDGNGTIDSEYLPLADMDGDGSYNSADASDVLVYYSAVSTNK